MARPGGLAARSAPLAAPAPAPATPIAPGAGPGNVPPKIAETYSYRFASRSPANRTPPDVLAAYMARHLAIRSGAPYDEIYARELAGALLVEQERDALRAAAAGSECEEADPGCDPGGGNGGGGA